MFSKTIASSVEKSPSWEICVDSLFSNLTSYSSSGTSGSSIISANAAYTGSGTTSTISLSASISPVDPIDGLNCPKPRIFRLPEDTEGATYPNDARLGTEPTDGLYPAAAATATGLDGSDAIAVIYATYALYSISIATSGGIPISAATDGYYITKLFSICCLFMVLSGSFRRVFYLWIFCS